MKKFLRENSLSLVFSFLTVITLGSQIVIGWHEFNDKLSNYGQPAITLPAYLSSVHCIEGVFKNWESEFLQMGLYVLLTVSLYQKGSSKSKQVDASHEETGE